MMDTPLVDDDNDGGYLQYVGAGFDVEI